MTFITRIGPEALEIHNGLPFRAEEEKQDINVVLNLWNSYCIGQTSVIYERYRFNNRHQGPSESIDAYTTALQSLAATCEFGSLKDEMIRDRLVLWYYREEYQTKIVAGAETIAGRCLDICRSSEATNVQLKAISGETTSTTTTPSEDGVNAVGKSKKSKRPCQRKPGFKPSKDMLKCCKHCGRSHIKQRKECPAFEKTCLACGKLNHFAEVCKSSDRKDQRRKSVNAVDSVDSSDEESLIVSFDSQEEYVNSVNENNLADKKIFATMEIEEKPVRMQIDTGASCNVLPQKFIPSESCIYKTDRTLKMYSKSTMAVLGTYRVSVRNPKNKKKYNVEFVIVEGDYPPLIRSRSSQQMNLVTVQQENILQVTPNSPAELTLGKIQDEFADIFKGQGCYKGKLHLEVNKSVSPVINPPRTVPFALKEKKSELDRLEELQIIRKVQEPTDWVSSLVIVEKPNGKLRVCIDPAHLNKALKRSHYDIPYQSLKISFLSWQMSKSSAKPTP